MNILKIQDGLKNLSDEQLAQEMRLPSGTAPQYLVMTEMQRRQKMRDEFSGSQPPKTTMAEEMSGEAPPTPPAGGMPPEGDEANAQGIMGLPDQTMAGGAMRAKISGQPQQVDDMTAMPPQGMAAGGAVQFGNPFAGAQMGSAAPSAGYSPIQQYSPKYYAPETGTDYGDIRHQFDGRSTPHTPNPRVHMSVADRYGLPAGMAAPTYGTPGLNRTYTGRDGQNVRYSWANDAARDAYIRYMTPPAKTTTAATTGANAPVAKAGGGPIHMFDGQEVNGGDWLPEGVEMVRMSGPGGLKQPMYRDPATGKLIPVRITGSPNASPFSEFMEGAFGREGTIAVPYGDNDALKKWGEKSLAAAKVLELKGQRNAMEPLGSGITRAVGNLFAPRSQAAVAPDTSALDAQLAQAQAQYEQKLPNAPAPLMGRDVPGAQKALSRYALPAATGATAPQKKATPPTASVSGQPENKASASSAATDGGLAALLAAQQDTGSKYKAEANALLDQLRGDREDMRQTDINNALIKFGLGLAGSKAGNLAAGVSEAGLPALQEYTAAREGRRKDERGLTADQLAILSKSEELSQADRKALQDAAVAQRQYEIDQRTLDIRQQEADAEADYYRSRASGAANIYSRGQIEWAKKIEADARDIVKRQSISDEDLRLAREILFESAGSIAGGGSGGPAPDPRESGLVPVN